MTCRICNAPICACPDAAYAGAVSPQAVVRDLRIATVEFQRRTLCRVLGIDPDRHVTSE